MAWWVAVRGSPLEAIGRFELNEAAAKHRAMSQSERHPGVAFEVRYHVNANARTEVRWEALDGRIAEARKEERRTTSERRIGVRHFACFPAHIERTGDVKRSAMMHDLSISGAMLVVNAVLAVGDVVSLQLHVSGDADARTRATLARVVRVERLEPAARGLWSHRVAVQFDEPLVDFEPEIMALGERQRLLGLRP